MNDRLLTIIIPVRKEEEVIRKTIDTLEKTVHTPHEIIIADDCISPSDTTIELVRTIHNPSIHISYKAKNDADGFGPALVRAIKKVKTPYMVIVMADASDDPKTIDTMVALAKIRNADIISGCRYMKHAGKTGGPLLQGVLSTLLNAFLFWILRFPTRDATNAFKLYKTSFIQSVLPKYPEAGVEFSLQLLIFARKKKPIVFDVPTQWHGREKGQSKVKLFSRGPKYLKLIFQI